jgi:hypothetical protein
MMTSQSSHLTNKTKKMRAHMKLELPRGDKLPGHQLRLRSSKLIKTQIRSTNLGQRE